MNTDRELERTLAQRLSDAGFESARFEAGQIASAACGVRENAFRMLERRLSHEPLQYILGEWEFYGLPFKVGPGVLIPRPDTEAVVDCALKLLKPGQKVFDLCAGSGCIGITLAKYQNAEVTFFEKSPAAAAYISQNLKRNGTDGQIVLCDVRKTVADGTADLIICNPPYVKSGDIAGLSPELSFEPSMALDGGFDGLTFYRDITRKWKKALRTGGYLVYEIGYDQRVDVCEILEKEGFTCVTVGKDFGGNDRVVYGNAPVRSC